jgi:hypothetical protein
MNLGNIAEVPVAQVLASERRARIRADAMAEPICRRCKGNLFVFDTAVLASGEQAIDKFGRGFWSHEPGLHGRDGRWTNGEAYAYVFARIPARRLKVDFYSEFAAATGLEMEIQIFLETDRSWRTEKKAACATRGGACECFGIDFTFLIGSFYRIILRSPSFVPDKVIGNGDTRSLGLAIHGMLLERAGA